MRRHEYGPSTPTNRTKKSHTAEPERSTLWPLNRSSDRYLRASKFLHIVLDVVVEVELVGMRTKSNLIDLMGSLVFDPA